MTALTYLSAREQRGLLERREVSAVELLDAHLARDAEVHTRINAVVQRDIDRARRDAATVDASFARGAVLGKLAGIPMTIKDGWDVENMPARSGHPALVNRPKDCTDAPIVARARKAGAVIWGKTNVPFMLGDCQSYNAFDGVTNNPYDLTRTPGGSSGGAAAALASGVTPLEIGSDIGGSLRNPASFCGLVALKPTFGRLPTLGQIPPMPGAPPVEPDLDVCGPMARNMGDLRLLWDVLAESSAPPPAIAGARIAIWADEPAWPLSGEAAASVERAATALTAAGMKLLRAKPAIDARKLTEAYQTLLLRIIGADLPPETLKTVRRAAPLAKLIAPFTRDPWSMWRTVLGFTASDQKHEAARLLRKDMKAALAQFFTTADFILMPVMPFAAFRHDHSEITQRKLTVDGKRWAYTNFTDWIIPATALHAPALSVQAGRTKEGLPIGVQLVGPWGSESALLALGAEVEQRLGGFTPPPL